MARPTTRSKGPDKVIIFGAIAVVLIIGIIILFRWMNSTNCETPVLIGVQGELITDGEIKFSDISQMEASTGEWDFGDSSAVETTKETVHIYNSPGQYVVRLTLDGVCFGEMPIDIKEAINEGPVVQDYPQALMEGPALAYVDEPIQFFDKTPSATSWEWSFGETGDIDSREQNPFYTFKKKGPHTVTLTVNNQASLPAELNLEVTKRKVNEPKPPSGGGGGSKPPVVTPPAPKRPVLTSENFFNALRTECGNREKGPDYLKALGQYFGGTLGTAKVVFPDGKKKGLMNWITSCGAKGCNFEYSKAVFTLDEFGDVSEIKLQK